MRKRTTGVKFHRVMTEHEFVKIHYNSHSVEFHKCVKCKYIYIKSFDWGKNEWFTPDKLTESCEEYIVNSILLE